MKTTKFRINIILIKICVYLLVFSLLDSIFIGCYSSKVVGKEKLFTESSSNLVNNLTIVTNEDKRIVIDEVIYLVIDDTLYAEGINKTNTDVFGKPIDVKFALADIQYVEIDALDNFRTIGCIISLIGVVILSIAAIVLGIKAK